jgi:hypothetical protein
MSLSSLAQLLGMQQRQPTTSDLGSGMAANAGNIMKMRQAYNDYSIDAQGSGRPAVSFEEFIAGHR